jgi:hypothetical protein
MSLDGDHPKNVSMFFAPYYFMQFVLYSSLIWLVEYEFMGITTLGVLALLLTISVLRMKSKE